MATTGLTAVSSDIADPDMQKFLPDGLPNNAMDMVEAQNVMDVSSEVDTILAYSMEKVANLENILLLVVARESDIGAIPVEEDDISTDLIEKALTFDLLCTFLISELRDLDDLMGDLQDQVADSLQKISFHEKLTESLMELVHEFHSSEDLIKQSQERILEMKRQLAKLQMVSFTSKQNEWKHGVVTSLKKEFQISSTELKPQMQTVEGRRILRMLEISLAHELELEKKLAEMEQEKKDLTSKVHLTEQVAVCMEEAAEAAWCRLLEAENAAEVLMGISKEMSGRLHIIQFNLNGSTKREEEMKSRLQACIDELKAKEIAIEKSNNCIAQLTADKSQVTHLREQVEMLQEKVNKTESLLRDANASNGTSQQQIEEMEGEIETLRENISIAESRAESAEEKVSHLTETNMELNEELGFLKGSNDSNAKKVSLLEKQLRELDFQLQHARATSEAGQEQQNMLYSAIWDMETLIDELKQKVSKAENNTESSEERYIALLEKNSELNKELDILKSRMGLLETSLGQAVLEKKSSAKDISIKTNFVRDLVMQLAVERGRIQNQLYSLAKENKLLKQMLQNANKHTTVVHQDTNRNEDKGLSSSGFGSADSVSATMSAETATGCTSEIFQVDRSPEDIPGDCNELESSSSTNSTMDVVADSPPKVGNSWKTFTTAATFVLLLSVLAAHLFKEKLALMKPLGS